MGGILQWQTVCNQFLNEHDIKKGLSLSVKITTVTFGGLVIGRHTLTQK